MTVVSCVAGIFTWRGENLVRTTSTPILTNCNIHTERNEENIIHGTVINMCCYISSFLLWAFEKNEVIIAANKGQTVLQHFIFIFITCVLFYKAALCLINPIYISCRPYFMSASLWVQLFVSNFNSFIWSLVLNMSSVFLVYWGPFFCIISLFTFTL